MNANLSTSTPQTNSLRLLPAAIGSGSALFYILFTLLPNSNSMMVKWPWVFIWQFGLMLGPIAVLFQLWQHSFRPLGHRIDIIAGAWCLTFALSAAFAPFPHQACWYGWAAICNIAFLYALNAWLTSENRVRHLLTFQGALAVIFSGQSLLSWYVQTVRPYQETLSELRTYGIERSFDLRILTLRNWHPIGHQNYVAGYLLLTIPLLVSLAASRKGNQRYVWIAGVVMSLTTLYSTASRGSWFGLAASLIVFIGLSAWSFPKLRKALLASGLVSLCAMGFWMLSSDRLRTLLTSLINADPTSDIAYRLVTNTTGWNIGLDHPLFGAGAGSITLLYQKYRPDWAGKTAELTYQLHSTPAQLWAELGIAGVLLTLLSLLALIYLSLRCIIQSGIRQDTNNIERGSSNAIALPIGIISALTGYSIFAITDYQLDNICISGTIICFTTVLLFKSRKPNVDGSLPKSLLSRERSVDKKLALAGSGLLLTISLWLYPIHRAWMLSSQGFLALQQEDINSFVTNLEKAHELAPWEPYYAYQLGWNLGELAFQHTDKHQQELLRQDAVRWFEKANSLSPNREFGYLNIGWLQVNSEPAAATRNFQRAAQLYPSKHNAFFSLGYSLLQEGKRELATQAMVIELFKQPILLTSPVWQQSELNAFYPQVMEAFENALAQQLKTAKTEVEKSNLHQIKGSLNWWRGDVEAARADFENSISSPLNATLLNLFSVRPESSVKTYIEKDTAAARVIEAWHQPLKTDEDTLPKVLIEQVVEASLPPQEYLEAASSDFLSSLSTETTFHEWLTRTPLIISNRTQRLGFGVISRHIDGPIPSDFLTKSSNVIVSTAFSSFFPLSEDSSPTIRAELSMRQKQFLN